MRMVSRPTLLMHKRSLNRPKNTVKSIEVLRSGLQAHKQSIVDIQQCCASTQLTKKLNSPLLKRATTLQEVQPALSGMAVLSRKKIDFEVLRCSTAILYLPLQLISW